MRQVENLIVEGKKVSGWVCRQLTVNSEQLTAKKEYDIVFIVMSQIFEPRPFIRTTPFKNSFQWRRFYFNKDIFDTVGATSRSPLLKFGKPDIFVIDEVGPLELEDRKGFWNVLPDIYSRHKETMTVVREGCVEKFKRSFPAQIYLVQPIQES